MSTVKKLQFELEETLLRGIQLSCLLDLVAKEYNIPQEKLIELGHSISDETIQAKIDSYMQKHKSK